MRCRPSLRVLLAALSPALVAIGCASTSTSSPDVNGVTSRTIEVNGHTVETNYQATGQEIQARGTPLAVMSALTTIYTDMQIPISTMQTSTGQLGNLNLRVPSHKLVGKPLSSYLNCGQEQMSGSRADLGDVTISVMSRAVAINDTTVNVTTNLEGWARPIGESSNVVPCQSTGTLEHLINVRVALAMASGA
jgi:hypothetical protein